MKKQLLLVVTMVLVASLMAGCGGKQEKSATQRMLDDMGGDNVDMVEQLTGIDDNTTVEIEEDEPTEVPTDQVADSTVDGDVIAGSQGAFVAKIMINNEEAPGTFKITKIADDNSEVVIKEGVKSGTEVTLEPGKYDFVFTTKKIVGNPEMTLRDVEIPTGRRVRREVKIPVGQITLVTGARCQRKPIKIKPKGADAWYKGKFFTCQPLILRAGDYDAEVGGGKRGTPITGIQVYDGGIRDILIRGK